jgi:hypothetical protein
MTGWSMNNELKSTGKKGLGVQLKVLSQQLLWGLRKTPKNLSQDSQLTS